MRQRLSKYNYCVLWSGRRVLFNCRTCALLELEQFSLEDIKNVVLMGRDLCADLGVGVANQLAAAGVVVDEDEVELLERQYQAARLNSSEATITIMPTWRCNLRCSYCYETRPDGSSLRERAFDVLEGLRSHICALASRGLRSLSVVWYGGEPMLEPVLVVEMSRALQAYAVEVGVRFSCSALTNGTALGGEVACELVAAGLNHVQIVLDGPRQVHDARRPMRSGRGSSYDRIVSNLRELVDVPGLSVALRVNVDLTNAEAVVRLFDELAGYGLAGSNSLTLGIAQVHATSGGCLSAADCLSTGKFAGIELMLWQEAVARGLRVRVYPQNRLLPCSAVHEGSFVIEPDGTVQRCPSLVGHRDQAVGVFDRKGLHVTRPDLWRLWSDWSPLGDEECRRCRVLPLCMGGCPASALQEKSVIAGALVHPRNRCSAKRYNLTGTLELLGEIAMREGCIPEWTGAG